MLLSWLIFALAHPQVVVDGDGACPDPGDIERRLGTLMLPVDERERQDRAHVQRSSGGLQIDLLRDDGASLAQRRLPATGSCDDLAAAAAVVIAAWEGHLRSTGSPEIELRVPSAPPPPPHGPAPAVDVGAAALASLAGDTAWGGTLAATVVPRRTGFGAHAQLSDTSSHRQTVGTSPQEAVWSRVALSLGPLYRVGFGAVLLDLRVEGVAARLAVAGKEIDMTASDTSWQVGAGLGARVAVGFGRLLPWLAFDVLAWPGAQTLAISGADSTAALPTWEAQLALGLSWRNFP